MKSILGIFLPTLLGLVNCYQQLTPPTNTTAELFPYHASIHWTKRWCAGALISENFVLATARCVINNSTCTVYLGYSRNPYATLKPTDGQMIKGEALYLHDDFRFLGPNKHSINDFALIKLSKNVELSKSVKPVTLASPDDFPIPPGSFVNISGFLKLKSDGELVYATVQERNIDLCNKLYGNSYLPSHERCANHKRVEEPFQWIGPYVVNGVLIGFHRNFLKNTTCESTPDCTLSDIYVSLEPALLWIYRISGVAGGNGKKLLAGDNPFWENRNSGPSASSQSSCAETGRTVQDGSSTEEDGSFTEERGSSTEEDGSSTEGDGSSTERDGSSTKPHKKHDSSSKKPKSSSKKHNPSLVNIIRDGVYLGIKRFVNN